MGIDTDFFRHRPGTLELALDEPGRSSPGHTFYGIYCSTCVKRFEMSSWRKVASYG